MAAESNSLFVNNTNITINDSLSVINNSNPISIPAHLKKYVKVVSRICTCEQYSFVVKTYKVLPTDAKGKVLKYGSEDQTYINFPELVNLIPRGCSDLFLDDIHICSLRGMKKFGGTSAIDEDDIEDKSSTEFYDDHTKVNNSSKSSEKSSSLFPEYRIKEWENEGVLEVEYQEKYNGKLVVFVPFKLNDQEYLFGGSKNVHVVINLHQYLSVNQTSELHYKMLYNVRSSIIDEFHYCQKYASNKYLNKEEQNFKNFFNNPKTYCGEYMDGTHIVYDPSAIYASYPKLAYIKYFDCPYLTNEDDEKITNNDKKRNIIPSKEYLQSIRDRTDSEGVIIIYRNSKTGEVYRQKHKTKWYVILRSWREIISRSDKNNTMPEVLYEKLIKRLHERSEQFLHLTNEELDNWKYLAPLFVSWLYKITYKLSDVSPFSDVGMGRLWYLFINRMKVTQEPEDNQIDMLSNLENKEYYDAIIEAAKFGYNVCVIMSGLPGSGKSTVAKYLYSELKSLQINVEIFSIGDLFMVDGKYQFDAKLIQKNSDKNFENFKLSTAQVKIVDNVNLQRYEYDRYVKSTINTICIVLHTKKYDVSCLESRNIHSVPLEALKKMHAKYKISAPAYFGVFPNKNEISILMPYLNITQTTPLHITVKFLGGRSADITLDDMKQIGKFADFEVTGVSSSEAGSCLVTKFKEDDLNGNHITLSTNSGFKPVDVGKSITADNTRELDSAVELRGIYLPMW
jgi:hypothetical protein